MNRVRIGILVAALFLGCSGSDTGPEPVNQAPTIEFLTEDIVFQAGEDHNLSVQVRDANADDKLTVKWTITSGANTLFPQNSQNTVMMWKAPSTVGTDTVRVTVSDGQLSAAVEEIVRRGTSTSESQARVRFTKAESPYILAPDNATGRLGVEGTTTIDPGVELYIDKKGATIDVLGTLISNGTEAEPVLIRPNDRTLSSGTSWWLGIQARTDAPQTGTVSLNYTEVAYGEYNVRLTEQATADIRNSKLAAAGVAGALISGVGTLTIRDSELTQNSGYGVQVASVSNRPASVLITGCEITFNGLGGINLSLPEASESVPITIRRNLIKFNSAHGIYMYNSVRPLISENEIWRNPLVSARNIVLTPQYVVAPATLDVINNFWGGAYTSAAPIKTTIIDSEDTAAIGILVNVAPWLTTSPLP